MSARDRIEYAVSIKHWCDRNPFVPDAVLIEFLEQIEKKIADQMVEQSRLECPRYDIKVEPISQRNLR